VSKKMFYTFAACVGLSILLMLMGFWVFGLTMLALVVLAWVPKAVRFRDRTGYEVLSVLLGWRKQRRGGAHILRAGTLSNQPGGRSRLPGIGASSEMWWGIDKLGRRFGMIHWVNTNQYAVVLRCSAPGLGGVEQDQIDLDVANWGEYINASGQTGDIDGVVTVVETIPETGARQDAEIARLCKPGIPAAARIAQDVVRESRTAEDRTGVQLHTRIAITFAATTAAKRKDPMLMIADLAERIPSICHNISTFRVLAEPMPDYAIAGTTLREYDPRPTVEAAVEESIRDEKAYVQWLDAGPVTAEETKKTYFHEGAASRSWVMSEPPAGASTERVLEKLLKGHPDVPRKRVTLIHRPMSPADAAVAVETGYLAARGEVNTQRGLASVRAEMKVDAAAQTRREEASGAGLTRVSMIVTISAETEAALDVQADTIDSLATSCRLKLRPAWRHQAAAFLSGIGVGVLLQDHSSTAKTLQA